MKNCLDNESAFRLTNLGRNNSMGRTAERFESSPHKLFPQICIDQSTVVRFRDSRMPRLPNDAFSKTKNTSVKNFASQNNSNNQQLKPEDLRKQGEVLLKDMVEMLEISPNARKLLHAPSLRVFTLRVISRNAEKDRIRLYELLRAWKKGAGSGEGRLVEFEGVFYDSKCNTVLLCVNQTNLYSFKVD